MTNLFNRGISGDVDIDAVDHAQGSNTKQNGDESNGVLKIIYKIFVKIDLQIQRGPEYKTNLVIMPKL